MAVILVLVCGFLGFTSAVGALIFFDISLYQAFGLWMFGGFAALILALVPAFLPHRAADQQAEIA